MMLRDNLYEILDYDARTMTFELALNAGHEIYAAHFPGRPITPAVCIIQIAKELMEVMASESLSISGVKNAKYLAAVSPDLTPRVNFTFTKFAAGDGGYSAQVHVHCDDVSYTKVSLTCTRG